MPYIPHTDDDVNTLLETIGAANIEALFDEIPAALRVKAGSLEPIAAGMSEMEITRLLSERAALDKRGVCFIGAGAYEHHIPAAVWEVASRGEFLTAYTPYQAEASQGTLQLLYEYQTMMANLMGMEVSNASLYDGASALAEAVLMAVRSQRHNASRHVLCAGTLHPYYRETVQSIVNAQGIQLIEIPFCKKAGTITSDCLKSIGCDEFAAILIPQPNFFGAIEDVDFLTRFAHAKGALVIALVNPIAMALLKEPGQWGDTGADIACGSGQPLGIPLASGGPYYGFLCCKQALVRQLPGRLIGRTTDKDGKTGYALTLQAREQHIRRSKATSNICTNQGLAVTASAIHMSILGFDGLRNVALASHEHNQLLIKTLTAIPGVKRVFETPTFHEVVLHFDKPIKTALNALSQAGVQGGFPLGNTHAEYENCLLICTTEMQTAGDIQHYADVISSL